MSKILNEDDTYGFPTGSVDTPSVYPGGTNGDWGGSMSRALEIASFAKACTGRKDVISSQKRTRVKTASGNVSDHYVKNMNAYAVDLRTFGKTDKEMLEKGDKLLKCIMKKFNNGSHASYSGNKWLNINIDGYRYQIGWRVKDHYNHIHVGVKRKGAGSSSNAGGEDFKKAEELAFDANAFGAEGDKNLNNLIDELKSRGVKDPENAIKNWINNVKDSDILKSISLPKMFDNDEFRELVKFLRMNESKEVVQDIERIKKILY
jgi:hypothetical protein